MLSRLRLRKVQQVCHLNIFASPHKSNFKPLITFRVIRQFTNVQSDEFDVESMLSQRAESMLLQQADGEGSGSLQLYDYMKNNSPETITIDNVNHVLKTCLAENQWERALDIFNNDLKELSLHPTEITYGYVIRLLANNGIFDKVELMLDEMISQSLKPNVILFTSLMHKYSRAGNNTRPLELLHRMDDLGVVPNLVSLNILLKSVELSGNHLKAVELVRQFGVKYNVFPDLVCYNIAIMACAKSNQWRIILDLISEMKKNGILPDVVTFNIAMRCCEKARQPETALMLLELMREYNVKPNVHSYSCAINAYRKMATITGSLRKRGSYNKGPKSDAKSVTQGILKLLEDMENDGVKPNNYTYNFAIISCGELKDGKTARIIFNRMVEVTKLKPNEYVYSAMISTMAACGNHSEAFKYFEMYLKDPELSKRIVVFNNILSSLNHSNNFSMATQVFQDIEKKYGLKPTPQTYTSMVALCGKHDGSSIFLDEVVSKLERDKTLVDVSLVNALILAYVRQHNPEKAISYFETLDELYGEGVIKPDAITLCTIMTAYSKVGDVEKAMKMLRVVSDNMLQYGVKNDDITTFGRYPPLVSYYFHALQACFLTKGDGVEAAFDILELMDQYNVKWTTETCNVALKCCERSFSWGKALKLLLDMETRHIPADKLSFYHAINACRKPFPHFKNNNNNNNNNNSGGGGGGMNEVESERGSLSSENEWIHSATAYISNCTESQKEKEEDNEHAPGGGGKRGSSRKKSSNVSPNIPNIPEVVSEILKCRNGVQWGLMSDNYHNETPQHSK
jgi:pentatricopeptide repeat protein